MVEGLAVKGDKKAAAEQIKALYKCFTDSDCTMVEVRLKYLASLRRVSSGLMCKGKHCKKLHYAQCCFPWP